MWCGHPDDPANPYIGKDITDEELEDLEEMEAELSYEAKKNDN